MLAADEMMQYAGKFQKSYEYATSDLCRGQLGAFPSGLLHFWDFFSGNKENWDHIMMTMNLFSGFLSWSF